MNQPWIDRWNERYGQSEFAYGKEPNVYLKAQLGKLSPGTILFPAEGEGRNSVYAATLSWKVSAFDLSQEGKKKAMLLAQSNNVTIDYQVGGLENVKFQPDQFDAMALIYAHFPAELKSQYHQELSRYLKKGGFVIFEAFSKKHLDYNSKNDRVGGPKELGMLFSMEEIQSDFPDFEVIELMETEIELSEGLYHQGIGSVIRFVGRKN